MIVSHRHKVCFWKVCRTGSSSIEMVLRLTARLNYKHDVIAWSEFFPSAFNMDSVSDRAEGMKGERRAHMTPETAIAEGVLTREQYDKYAHFCITRDPVDRFISTYTLALRQEQFDANQLISAHVRPNIANPLFRPQVDYCTLGNMTALPYENFRQSAAEVCRAFKAPVPRRLPRLASRHPKFENRLRAAATEADRAAIETFYAADVALYQQAIAEPVPEPVIVDPYA